MEKNFENNGYERNDSNQAGGRTRRPRIGARPSGDGERSNRSYGSRPNSGNSYSSSRDDRQNGEYNARNNNGYNARSQYGSNSRSYSNDGNRSSNYNRGENNYNRGENNYNRGENNYNRGANNYNRGDNNYNRGEGGYNRGENNYANRGENSYNRSNSNYNRNNGEANNRNYNSTNNYGSNYGERREGGYNRRPGGYNNNNRREGGYDNRQNSGYNRNNRYNNYDNNPNSDYNPNAKYSQKKQIEYKKQFVDYSQPMRLNKFLANAGLCSRREADEFIQAGVVSVNGEVVTELGSKVTPSTDKVLFHDQLVRSERKVYILLNKPKDCVTTVEDAHAKLTVLDLVKNACSERVYPVGRLDRNTTGVLLITNDGDLTSKLTHPKYDKKKIYQVTLDRDLEDEDYQKISAGLALEDGDIKVDEISFVYDDDRRNVGVEIHSGKNRIVRRIFDSLGYHVVKLDRVYFAGLTKKNLPRGKWRHLSEMEVNMLKMSAAVMKD